MNTLLHGIRYGFRMLLKHDHAWSGEYFLEENAGAVLSAAVGLACWLPTRRASGIDPVTSVRAE